MEELGELDERFGFESCEARRRGACAVEVDVDVGKIEADGLAVGDDAGAVFFVEEGPELAQAPAEAATWIVGHVPEQIGELLASVISARGREIAQKRAGFLGRRQIDRLAVTLEAEWPEQSQSEGHGRCGGSCEGRGSLSRMRFGD
jgi:hypothetical protein